MSATKLWWRIGGSVLTVVVLAMALVNLLGWLAYHQVRIDTDASADDLDALVVEVDSGSVEIVGVDSPTIHVEGTVTSGLVRTRHDELVDGERFVVRSSCPSGLLSNYCEVTYRIEVPEALTVRVDARDAQVTVRDLRGAVDVATTNDVVRADSLAGEVSLESSNDDVLASGMGPGAVRIVTSNARVEAGFSEPPARVEIQTSNDDVDVVVPDTDDVYAVDLSTSNGTPRAEIRTDPTSDRVLAVRTSNGDVRVGYPAT
jgi:hypothetical protein